MSQLNTFGDPLETFRKMERLSRIGWCAVDVADRKVIFSDYLVGELQLPGEELPIEEFAALVHPEHRKRTEFSNLATDKAYTHAFAVRVGEGYRYVEIRLEPAAADQTGRQVMFGMLRLISREEFDRLTEADYYEQLGELIKSQSYISQLLLRLLRNPDIDSIIHDILSNIVDKFNADRSYIFSFDKRKRTHSCIYEVTQDGITSEMDDLQDWPIDASPWWCEEILADRSHIIEDTETLKDVHQVEYEVLAVMQDIKSLMVVPLANGDGVWGYIGVDIVGHNRTWSGTERQWFEAIGNYISVCLELHRKVEEVHTGAKMIASVSEFAEVGYVRVDTIRSTFYATPQWYKNVCLEVPAQDKPVDFSIEAIPKFLAAVHPEDAAVFNERTGQMRMGEIESFQQDVRIKDGEGWKWLRSINTATERDPRTGNMVLLGFNHNITEVKQAEQRLIEAKARAEENDRQKSAFLANMSHEIRTPLNAIVGFANILGQTDDRDEREQFLSIIQQNTDQLLQLVADIIDLSKIEAGVFDVVLGEVDVNQMCANVVSSLKMKAQPGVEMSFTPERKQCVIRTDRNRLSQVLINYLGNATKLTSEGHITLSYTVQEGWITFRVEDTGCGMSPEQAATAFDRFVKFNNYASGTGLGLSISRSIAERLGGRVGVESDLGKGSAFWVSVPFPG